MHKLYQILTRLGKILIVEHLHFNSILLLIPGSHSQKKFPSA